MSSLARYPGKAHNGNSLSTNVSSSRNPTALNGSTASGVNRRDLKGLGCY